MFRVKEPLDTVSPLFIIKVPLLKQSTVDNSPLLSEGTDTRQEVPLTPNTLLPSVSQALSPDGDSIGLTLPDVSVQLAVQVASSLQELNAASDEQVYLLPLPRVLVPVYEELSLLPPQADNAKAEPITHKLKKPFN